VLKGVRARIYFFTIGSFIKSKSDEKRSDQIIQQLISNKFFEISSKLCNNQPTICSNSTKFHSTLLHKILFLPCIVVILSQLLDLKTPWAPPPALVAEAEAEAEAVAAVAFHYEFLYNFPMISYPPVLSTCSLFELQAYLCTLIC
jgi:hypothetical protein